MSNKEIWLCAGLVAVVYIGYQLSKANKKLNQAFDDLNAEKDDEKKQQKLEKKTKIIN